MNFAQYVKQIARAPGTARDLSEEDGHDLFCAMLDGGVPDLELAALLVALRLKSESLGELLGFCRAAGERLYRMNAPVTQLRPLVVPAYGGARSEHNLLPLLGLLLRRLGVPVLFHGTLEGSGRIASVYILRELGVMPSATLAQAQAALEEDNIAFLPMAALCPGLANLLALRNRLGVRNSAHVVAKLIDPFAGEGVILAGASSPPMLEKFAAFFAATGQPALLLASTEGEPFANPRQRPRMEFVERGQHHLLFDEEVHAVKPVAGLPPSVEAQPTAAWILQALAGEVPIPHPLVNQLACCLYVTGYTEDMNQAKAIAAVEAGSLASVAKRRAPVGRAARAAPRQ
jgi:anthranilate phosphoribosyltransferase